MTMENIIETVRGFDGVLVLTPDSGSEAPKLAWGDTFFYYAPDGQIPQNIQPYATIVTKNYPDDTASNLDPEGRWRVNIQVEPTTFREVTGEDPRSLKRAWSYDTTDAIMPHPIYGPQGWISVVNPASTTIDTVKRLLEKAHVAAHKRYERRLDTN